MYAQLHAGTLGCVQLHIFLMGMPEEVFSIFKRSHFEKRYQCDEVLEVSRGHSSHISRVHRWMEMMERMLCASGSNPTTATSPLCPYRPTLMKWKRSRTVDKSFGHLVASMGGRDGTDAVRVQGSNPTTVTSLCQYRPTLMNWKRSSSTEKSFQSTRCIDGCKGWNE